MRVLSALAVLALAAPLRAQQLPDLRHQGQWGDAEKREFLQYLSSGEKAPIKGQVREVTPSQAAQEEASYHKARYVSLSLVTDTLFTESDASIDTQSTNVGPKLLVGSHLFSWLRYYAGLQYNNLQQKRLDGTNASLAHWQLPVGIEMALIPLGTPQSRYVLLRLGVSGHDIEGPGTTGQYKTPLYGLHAAWNASLGYEWQVSNTPWRWNVLAEGYRSFQGDFFGLGLTAGVVRTF